LLKNSGRQKTFRCAFYHKAHSFGVFWHTLQEWDAMKNMQMDAYQQPERAGKSRPFLL